MTSHKQYEPDNITLSAQDTQALKKRIAASNLPSQDIKILLNLISFNRWMQERLGRAKLTIKRLRQLFNFTSESKKKAKPAPDDSPPDEEESEPAPSEPEDKDEPSPEEEDHDQNTAISAPHWNSQANHGRLSAQDYTGCPITYFTLSDPLLQQGQCPACADCQTDAKVTPEKPMVVVFLKGQPLISGERHSFERVRCTVCQTYFTASPPDTRQDQSKYDVSCKTTIAINHYYAGSPFKRIETLQNLQGIPVADATQYDLMHQLYGAVIQPIVQVLRDQAAQGTRFFFDDTSGRILDQINANNAVSSRQDKAAIHTTALLSEQAGHRIYLFNTSKLTAGKEFKALLSNRQSDDAFLSMSDASPHNFPTLDDPLLAQWIISLCLSHSRRKFVELLSESDQDIQLILDIIADVYHHEKQCQQNNLTDQARMTYHQTHSEPRLLALKAWLNNLMLHQRVEPNSPLGEAIRYLLKRWHWLTQFLRVPGAVLDNNICERSIKIVIRYRKNSLFYKSFYGATIGDAMMSVLHTAAEAQVNMFDYLNTLQIHVDAVNACPEQWLPWNYEQTRHTLTTTTLEPAIAQSG